jgi:hypothetical protein
MRHIAISAVVAIVFVVSGAKGFVAQAASIPITDCGSIAQAGTYVAENNLVAPFDQDCLVISSSHVRIDMNGKAITAACLSPSCIPTGSGGIAVHITSEADHVSISHLVVENYVSGIVVEGDHTSVAGASLNAFSGISLNNVHHSAFTDVAYTPANRSHHPINGPIVSVAGGGHNTISLANAQSNSQIGVVSEAPGILITSSSYNLIEGGDILAGGNAVTSPGILLTGQSNHNSIANTNIVVFEGNGIEVDLGSDFNLIQSNVVEILASPGFFALLDQNPNCGSNIWIDNIFSNDFAKGQISANPASCID